MLNEEIAGLVGGLRSTSGSSLAAFSRMEEKVLALEAEAEASSQLGGVRPSCASSLGIASCEMGAVLIKRSSARVLQ